MAINYTIIKNCKILSRIIVISSVRSSSYTQYIFIIDKIYDLFFVCIKTTLKSRKIFTFKCFFYKEYREITIENSDFYDNRQRTHCQFE